MNATKDKKESGVTLIALVITVIILIIIVGAAIAAGLSSDSVFEKAEETVDNWNQRVYNDEQESEDILKTMNNKNKIKQVLDANPGVLEGSGTANDPWVINSIEDLVAFAYNVNSNSNLYSGQFVELGLSLDMQSNSSYANPATAYTSSNYGYSPNSSGTSIKNILTDNNGSGFIPIGNGQSNGFAGTFNGNNYSINNLYINSTSFSGLFGATASPVNIYNLELKECDITSSNNRAGGIIAKSNSNVIIDNCITSGSVNGNQGAAGMIGECISAKITNSYNTCDVQCTSSYASGIMGNNSSSNYGSIIVLNCYNGGTITANGSTGGIIAIGSYNSSNIIANCFNYGNMINTGGEAVGGIAGETYHVDFLNCYNVGKVTGWNYTGGVIGKGRSASHCYNTGDVTGDIVGGVLGFGYNVKVSDCHNTGLITGTRANRPDLCGEISGYYYDGGNYYTGNTYLIKTSNVTSHGGSAVADMTSTMSMSNFVTLMNNYAETNNSNSSNTKLKTWKLENGYPVFAN
ncbi:MAG: hypothetical protein IKP28_00935 [Clostridia bacterium]|nr:hypothetical protein [Clostridia bacterium]